VAGPTSSNRTTLALLAIVVAACSLSLYWVFLVPIFQAGDEDHHIDYVFNIYSAGRLLSAREPARPWNTRPSGTRYDPDAMFHIYTVYLIHVADEEGILTRPGAKVPDGYGTAAYYRELDSHAPRVSTEPPAPDGRRTHGTLTMYPFGYYALAAAWMGLAGHIFGDRLTVLFFGARILSVFLLAASLVLTYLVIRELGIKPARSRALTAVVGFFPLTSYVSSYVQPDNLGFTLVMLCCYLALVVRRKPYGAWLTLLLGCSLGALLVTKYQFYVCVLPPVLGLLLTGRRMPAQGHPSATIAPAPGRARFIAMLGLPSLVLGLVQLWIVWGPGRNTITQNPNLDHTALSDALSHGAAAAVAFVVRGAVKAFQDYYLGGLTFRSYWGAFGWTETPLVIVSEPITQLVRTITVAITIVMVMLALLRLGQVTAKLTRVARRGRARAAL
jgi:hypothetical protein